MTSVLSSFSLFVVSHPVLYVIDAEPYRVNEVRKAIRSSRVLELGVVSV